MKKELLVFYCETTGQGIQHCDKVENPNQNDIDHAIWSFNTWSNCYLIKIRTTDENDMFSDEVICKRNIEL